MPAAESLEVVERMVVAVHDVIALVSRFAAWNAARVESLALRSVSSEDKESTTIPIGGKPVASGAGVPWHEGLQVSAGLGRLAA